MKRVCAWCQQTLSETEGVEEDAAVSHGICRGCIEKLLADEGVPLLQFLDTLPCPVLVVSQDARILGANQQACELVGKPLESIRDQLGGDVFGCEHAGKPGGCGKTIHCKSCTIRRTVMATHRSGRPQVRVPAYPELHMITGVWRVKFLISTRKVGDVVLLQIDEVDLQEASDPPGE